MELGAALILMIVIISIAFVAMASIKRRWPAPLIRDHV